MQNICLVDMQVNSVWGGSVDIPPAQETRLDAFANSRQPP